jgi:hypothetical protein
MPVAGEIIDAPFQIICEGRDDVDFFCRLLRDRNIANYNVGFGKGEDGRPLGKDGFGKRIDALLEFPSVPIRGIIIVADSDDAPEQRFAAACANFKGRSGFPIPKAAMQQFVSGNPKIPKTAVLMIPRFGVEGGLETLALSCCEQLTEFRNCIDDFCRCVHTPRRLLDCDKLRLRAVIAAMNPDDPSASISTWLSSGRRPFAMTHVALDAIAQFIIDFSM